MNIDFEIKALNFARAAHASIGQVRKYTGEPYIEHPMAVAAIVNSVERTSEMMAAAYLHDVVEDTPVTAEQVRAAFGDAVADLVDWLTDVSKPSDGNRRVRKALDREHIARAPAEAKTIKLADLIDNTRTIALLDPNFWPVYRAEKLALLEVLREGNPALWNRAMSQVSN